MTEPTHIKSTRMASHTSIYRVEVSAGELTRVFVIEAGSFAEAELKALEFWHEDEVKTK